MKKQYTIKDIAKKLNLHHTTISRALRNHPDVNKETRKLVLDAAKKYNYVPNSFAKSLRNSKSKTIAVMVPQIKSFFFSEILGVISNLAVESGYSMMIYQSNEDPNVESKNIDVIIENRVAGVIASIADTQHNAEKYKQLQDSDIPVVLFDRTFENTLFPSVIINNYQGAFDATEYLIQAGYKNIAFYNSLDNNPVFAERFKGYLGALTKYRRKETAGLTFKGGISIEDGIKLINNISSQSLQIDAMICCVDMVALGVIVGSRDLQIEIPEQLALIGFDNEPAGRIIRPSLTTVAQPVDVIGRTAFGLLLDKIDDHKNENNEALLNMNLIKRKSG